VFGVQYTVRAGKGGNYRLKVGLMMTEKEEWASRGAEGHFLGSYMCKRGRRRGNCWVQQRLEKVV